MKRRERVRAICTDVPVEVYVGGKRADVTYRGRSGCCAGIDQIVFTVPQGVEGCYVPVVVKTGDVVSNFVNADRFVACRHLHGSDRHERIQLETAQRNGTSSLRRNHSGADGDRRSAFRGWAGSRQRRMMAQLVQPIQLRPAAASTRHWRAAASHPRFWAPAPCSLPVEAAQGPVDVVRPRRPGCRAGDQHQWTERRRSNSRNNRRRRVLSLLWQRNTKHPGFPGGGRLHPTIWSLEPIGSITAQVEAVSNAVGAFYASITIPQLLNWTNMDAIETVTRPRARRSPGPAAIRAGSVYMLRIFQFGVPPTTPRFRASIARSGPAPDGSRFPRTYCPTLPATTRPELGLVSVNNVVNPVTFTAPGLDAGAITATAGSSKTVTFR